MVQRLHLHPRTASSPPACLHIYRAVQVDSTMPRPGQHSLRRLATRPRRAPTVSLEISLLWRNTDVFQDSLHKGDRPQQLRQDPVVAATHLLAEVFLGHLLLRRATLHRTPARLR